MLQCTQRERICRHIASAARKSRYGCEPQLCLARRGRCRNQWIHCALRGCRIREATNPGPTTASSSAGLVSSEPTGRVIHIAADDEPGGINDSHGTPPGGKYIGTRGRYGPSLPRRANADLMGSTCMHRKILLFCTECRTQVEASRTDEQVDRNTIVCVRYGAVEIAHKFLGQVGEMPCANMRTFRCKPI